MVARLLSPLPALLSAVLAVGLALVILDHGFGRAAVLVAMALVVTGGVVLLGRALLGSHPYRGALLMEASALVLVCLAALAGALLVWLAIKHTPATNATQRDKQVFTGLSAALTAYLGSVIIKPEGESWNAVRSSVKGVFAKSFTQRRTPIEKDARDAVQLDGYGAQAPEHAGQVVEGWGWGARRTRTRHIQDQLDA